jgi:hypothetical protein
MTAIRVVRERFASGMSEDDTPQNLSELTREGIRVCLALAPDRDHRLILPDPSTFAHVDGDLHGEATFGHGTEIVGGGIRRLTLAA